MMNRKCVWFIIISSFGLQLWFSQPSLSQNNHPAPQKQKKIISKKIAAPETRVDMVKIPAGIFGMGSYSGEGFTNELPYHPVYLDSFYIDVYEVTNIDYVQFLNAGENDHHYHPLMSDDQFCGIFKYPNGRYAVTPGREDYPVTNVTWEDAAAYAKWCGKRLPTEAEWEKAARGNLAGKKYPFGNYITREEANFFGIKSADRWDYVSPVGSFEPNGYGLYDMSGNVWEWVQDYYNANFYISDTTYNPVNEPKEDHSNTYRIIRGGSWADDNEKDSNLRVESRGPNYPIPENWAIRIGFRCASSYPPSREREQQAGLDYLAEKMQENNPKLYGNLSLDSLKSILRARRTQKPVFKFGDNVKSMRKAVVYSLLIPGTGELYTGRFIPALFFLVVEGASLSLFINKTLKANAIDVQYGGFAGRHFNSNKYIGWMLEYQSTHGGAYPPSYAGHALPATFTSGFYNAIGAYDQFLAGWDDFNPAISQNGYSENRKQYNDVRSSRKKSYNDYHKQAKYAGMFVIGNHLLSIMDTIWGLKRHSIYRSEGLSWDMDARYYNLVPVPTLHVRYKW